MAHQADCECVKKITVPFCTKRRTVSTSGLSERKLAKVKPFNVAPDAKHRPITKSRDFTPYEDVETLAKHEIQDLLRKENKGPVPKIKVDSDQKAIAKKCPRSANFDKDEKPCFRFGEDDKRKTLVVPIYKEKQQPAVKGPAKRLSTPIFNSTTKQEAAKQTVHSNKKKTQPLLTVNKQVFYSTKRSDVSPILPNPFTEDCVLISKRLNRMREPKLKHRSSRTYSYDFYKYVGDIYNEEYLEDFIEVAKQSEKHIILPQNFMSRFECDYQNSGARAYIINWMFKLQADINFSECEFYLAVNLLDQVAARIAIPNNMYQLVALTTTWIAIKNLGFYQKYASELLKECNNVYHSKQLIRMEQKVLKLLNFKIHIIEPSIPLNYYLKVLGIHEIQLASVSAYYILDCFTLCPEFSMYPISITAAAVVTVCVQMYMSEKSDQMDTFFKNKITAKEGRLKKLIEGLLYSQLHKMKTEDYPHKNIFKKDYFNKIVGK